MAIIPSFFSDATVALGVPTSFGKKHWIGTGFLVGRRESANTKAFTVYVITNKHVVHNKKRLYVRFNNITHNGVKDLPMKLVDDAGQLSFSTHPSENADVVAIQISPQIILDRGSSLHFFHLDGHAQTLAQMQKSGIDEGSLVYALGFPMNLVNDTVKAPICRLGCIARIADAFLNPTGSDSYLVDVDVFPGNSGGPIISRPESLSIKGTPHNSSALLIGILSAYLPYRDKLVSQQTGEVRMVQAENSGLTIVHPVDRIKEVVELEWQRTANLHHADHSPSLPLPTI